MNLRYGQAMQCLAEIEEYGLIGKKPRPAQKKAIRAILHLILNQNKKYIVLTAPTGAGKSFIAAAVGAIMNETEKWKTNLTTSNRALQVQYGEDLRVDPRFKVIMGNQNYKCSFFPEYNEETKIFTKGQWSTCGNSPCQEYKNSIESSWSTAIPVKPKNNQIKTIHEDQDESVLEEVSKSYNDVQMLLAIEDNYQEDSESRPPDTSMGALKRICFENGSCSFLMARSIAELSPVAIRSIQHMAFYIMFGVKSGGMPILQTRDLHINDECHHIDKVFRDLFSCEFRQKYYKDTVVKALDKEQINGLTFEFSEFKRTKEREWNDAEKLALTMKLAADLASVIEVKILPEENQVRLMGEKVVTAAEFVKLAGEGKIHTDIDSIDQNLKTIVKWYKNLAHANYDARMSALAKSKNHQYNKRYSTSVDVKDGLKLKVFPVTLDGMVNKYMGEKHTVFMSATPQEPKIFEKIFGIEGEVGYIEVESDFPPERSPIFWEPVDKITTERAKEIGMELVAGRDFKNEIEQRIEATREGYQVLYAKLAVKIREIVDHFPEYTGIIPCPSYTLVKELRDGLDDISRFIWATDGVENKKKIVEFRKRAKNGEQVILVSAGIAEGQSFNDDISRLQIIPKMPLPAQSPEIMELTARWKTYYPAQTAITLQQMAGRSMRSSNDFCLTIVLDQKFDALKAPATQKLYSQHFNKCVQWEKDWRNFSQPIDSENFS